MSWIDGVRARLGLLSGRSAETRMQREFGFHMQMEAERLMREEGLAPAEARRRAAVAFGGVEKYQEELRSERGLDWLKGTALDLKVGLRLLIKHQGFTLVSGLGIMVATAFMSGIFAFMYSNIYPKLPLSEGDRIVGLENWDLAVNNESQQSLHDFILWRSELKSVTEISAFHEYQTQLVVDNTAWPVNVASMTASAFRLARVAPLLGRYLTEADEREGASDVLVIGYDAWRDRFQQDRSVIGREVRLGRQVYTIVGVMPEGYGFPLNHHYWVPFRLDPLQIARGEGPVVWIFGRLASDATIESAQAELSVIGQRTAAQFPLTNGKLKPAVLPYTQPLLDIQGMGPMVLLQSQLMTSLVLFVVAMNVAILVYARTAMRRGEIAIRTALGASRTRIVVQLFLEAFVLALIPALLGLPLTQYALRVGQGIMDQEFGGPVFWSDLSLQPSTVIYTLIVVVIAAAIIGVIPALRATGRQVQGDIRQLGGGGGMKLGKMWTVMIAAQVAVAVAALPPTVKLGLGVMNKQFERPNFHGEFVTFSAALSALDSMSVEEGRAFFGERAAELIARVAADRDVDGVTFTSGVPNLVVHKRIEVSGAGGKRVSVPSEIASVAGVDTSRFTVLGLPILAGRAFGANDVAPGATSVIVNRTFVRKVLGDLRGSNAVGHRLRYINDVADDTEEGQPSPWYEIVGVIEDMTTNPINTDAGRAALYFPVTVSQVRGATVLVRLKPSVNATLPVRLHGIATEMPALLVGPVTPWNGIDRQAQLIVRLVAMITVMVMLSVLLLSAAGVYALMSFTVTQRWREIGIRSALGATPPRVLAGVFSRVAVQIGSGIGVGIVAAIALDRLIKDVPGTGGVIPAVVMIMTVVGFAAALGPARRGLRVQPIDALKTH